RRRVRKTPRTEEPMRGFIIWFLGSLVIRFFDSSVLRSFAAGILYLCARPLFVRNPAEQIERDGWPQLVCRGPPVELAGLFVQHRDQVDAEGAGERFAYFADLQGIRPAGKIFRAGPVALNPADVAAVFGAWSLGMLLRSVGKRELTARNIL